MSKDIQLTENFWLSEFRCPCCGEVTVDIRLVQGLQRLRDIVDRPVNVSSGFRCKRYNGIVGGVTNSEHLYGRAADIHISYFNPKRLGRLFEEHKLPFTGIGVYRSKNFVHVDVREKPAEWEEE